jgi:ABC-type lipoprotein release transport system permease subunit
VGTSAALLSGSLLRSLVFGITPLDPLTFAAVALMITIVSVIACYIPARNAIITDPAVALRYE